MKIKLEGQWVCSVCGAIWETYYGLKGNEPAQCASCGAGPNYEEPGFCYEIEGEGSGIRNGA